MMAANLQALKFSKSLDSNLLKECFNALRQNKEHEKFMAVDFELNEVERPRRAEELKVMNAKTNERADKSSNKAAEIFGRLANKNIYQYFDKWR